jgi:hypothetical protein
VTDRSDTIGAVHWGGMYAGTDGEQIVLVIPAFFQPGTSRTSKASSSPAWAT